jgi:hypothetical protein
MVQGRRWKVVTKVFETSCWLEIGRHFCETAGFHNDPTKGSPHERGELVAAITQVVELWADNTRSCQPTVIIYDPDWTWKHVS